MKLNSLSVLLALGGISFASAVDEDRMKNPSLRGNDDGNPNINADFIGLDGTPDARRELATGSCHNVQHYVIPKNQDHRGHNDWFSPSGTTYRLVKQFNGNVFLEKNELIPPPPLWKTTVAGSLVMIMQSDGNFCLYDKDTFLWWSWNNVKWCSGTHGNPNAQLVLQTDGNLVIYRNPTAGDCHALWSAW